jgi:hypothetical protein
MNSILLWLRPFVKRHYRERYTVGTREWEKAPCCGPNKCVLPLPVVVDHHCSTMLVNAVGNPIIPLTNNTVELVIRRFDQHY